ncbi:MAG: hypothetical protein JSU90_06625 [Nitrospiraceae bacterium]|nr:MAG: hypothetical protein JSU90_06625 [Nitrospiraceae bacterium]
MLEDIALIAAVISGLTALTTSLRALGISREQARPAAPSSQRSSIRLHFFVTAVWYALSVLCSLPALMQNSGSAGMQRPAALLLFFLLTALIALVWKKVLQKR